MEKIRIKCIPISSYSCIKHPNNVSYDPSSRKFVQMNGPDISLVKIQFPDKNNLFACLQFSTIFPNFSKKSQKTSLKSKLKIWAARVKQGQTFQFNTKKNNNNNIKHHINFQQHIYITK